MDAILEIMRILLPLSLVGGIAIFVVSRMIRKRKKGALGKKTAPRAQQVLDRLIAAGPLMGLVIALVISMLFPVSLMAAMVWGPGVGLLGGYVAYEWYSQQGEDYS